MVLAMECVNGLLAFIARAHGDETEATGALGLAVHHEDGVGHGAVLSEELAEVLFAGLEGKISHVQFHIYLFEVTTSQPSIEVRARAHMSYLWERNRTEV